MRIVYMDEAGRGSAADEPYFVVAAAITHPDTQWQRLRKHYDDLANDVFGLTHQDELRCNYVFHAKDVLQGNRDFPRAKFRREERLKIIERLSQVPRLYEIPICLGVINKKEMLRAFPGEKAPWAASHAGAYAIALQCIDTWMQSHCQGEVATVKAEDVDSVKRTLEWVHEGAKKSDNANDYYDRNVFVTSQIVDAVSFLKKEHSPILQVADHCAYLAQRKLMGFDDVTTAWRNIWPQVQTKNVHSTKGIRLMVPVDKLRMSGGEF